MNLKARKAASCVVGLIVVLGFANCNKKSGEAVCTREGAHRGQGADTNTDPRAILGPDRVHDRTDSWSE